MNSSAPKIPHYYTHFRSKNFVGKKNAQIQGKSAVHPIGLTSILTQYMGIFLRQNRGRMLSIKGAFDVLDNIVGVFDSNRKTDKIGGYAAGDELFIGQLAVGSAGGMKHAGSCIGHVGDDSRKLQVV